MPAYQTRARPRELRRVEPPASRTGFTEVQARRIAVNA
jgi:hypothetical protein